MIEETGMKFISGLFHYPELHTDLGRYINQQEGIRFKKELIRIICTPSLYETTILSPPIAMDFQFTKYERLDAAFLIKEERIIGHIITKLQYQQGQKKPIITILESQFEKTIDQQDWDYLMQRYFENKMIGQGDLELVPSPSERVKVQ